MNRLLPVSALISLLAACGGSSGNAAASKTFTYGAPQTPTQSEQGAATAAQGQLSTTADFSASPTADKGASLIAFADEMAANALGSSSTPLPHPSGPAISRSLRNADFSSCSTVTATSVVFNNCSQNESGFTFTLNGSVTVAAGVVSWDINGGFTSTGSNGSSGNVSMHESGNLAVTATKVSGKALSDLSGTATNQGKSVSFGLATAVLMDLTYQSSPICVTGGTMEVKRVWTQKPAGVSGTDDVAVKLSWTGCNAVQIAHGK